MLQVFRRSFSFHQISMNQQWQDNFSFWAQSPSKTETERAENAEQMVRNAIKASSALNARDIKVFAQGSYRNRTNIRRESDVDIGVLCYDTFFFENPAGTTRETLGIQAASYDYDQFKTEVGQALVSYFGSGAVTPGDKAFDIKETSHHVEADVAPFFEHRRYDKSGKYISGVELHPTSGQPLKIKNWPEQHYANGNAKNDRTRRSYRALVRIFKSLRCEMEDDDIAAAKPVGSFLCECLIWNVQDSDFTHSDFAGDLRAALIFLFENTASDALCKEWGEVSELKYLFGPHQKWTRQQANDFILAVWQYVGFT
jgi:hypothetical protein